MIFPNIDARAWMKKYPTLEQVEGECIDCATKLVANKPFLSTDYAGLISEPCNCGSTRSGCRSSVTRTAEAHASWQSAMNGVNIE